MGARHHLPYAYAKAHTMLLEDDGSRLVLWAPETIGLSALPDGDGERFAELRELLRTTGVAEAGELVQRRERPHPNCYLGPGKI